MKPYTSQTSMLLKATPYKHQSEAYRFVCDTYGLGSHNQISSGAALLMEMGCGKTLTTIGIIGKLSAQSLVRKVLIVAPLSIVSVWRDELAKFAGFAYEVHILQGSVSKKAEVLANLPKTHLQIVIVNYESAWRLEGQLAGFAPDMIVADEAHKLKTHNTKQSKAMHRLGAKAKYTLLLTGTIITNKAIDVFSQYKFLNPAIFGQSFYTFRNRYFNMVGYGGYTPVLKREMEGELMDRLHSIAYRTTKAECLDLPETTDIIRMVELEPSAQSLYRDLVKDSYAQLAQGEVTATNILTRLLRLSQLTGGFLIDDDRTTTAVSKAKLDAFSDILDEAMNEEQKVVVIARFLPEIHAIEKLLAKKGIGANASTSAFKQYLFNDLKFPVLKTTAKYQEAADDETMILLSEYCKEHRPELVRLFELVQEYRKWGKLKSTYIDGYLQHINPATGRIHPELFPLGTETGRFAARKPNLQNMPCADGDVSGIRNFIRAPQGKLLLSLDFSQIELRVGAFYCRDEMMLETYRTGGDIHAQTTSVIYKIPFTQAKDKNAEHYKERRTIAKNCNFGTFYGLFPRGLQRTLRFKAGLPMPLWECAQIIENLKAGYPRLTAWQEETKEQARIRRYTETWLGRRRYLPGITSSDWGKKSFAERCALNTPIQGTAADILKLALKRLIIGLPERPWLKPLLQIHDELVFEIPKDKESEAIDFIKECMEAQPFTEFDVPIIAEAAVGTRFGEMEEISCS